MGAADAIGTAAGSIAAGLLIDHLPLRSLVNVQAAIYLVAGAVALSLFTGGRSDAAAAS